MNLGRNQLLNWVNDTLQCEYNSIEQLSDGVAYCQLLDALYPNTLNFTRLNLSTRYPDDCLRNLRILQSALKKLKINQPASFQKISQGKFQDNILLLQWLYGYTMKNGYQNLQYYEAYSRRIQIMQRQNKNPQQMNAYLIPTQAYKQYTSEQDQYGQYMNEQQQQYYDEQQQQHMGQYDEDPNDEQTLLVQKKQELQYRIALMKQDTMTLQLQMKTQMETNWKLMHSIQRSIQERNTMFLLLKQIQTIIKQADNSSVGTGILSVVHQVPEDFLEVQK